MRKARNRRKSKETEVYIMERSKIKEMSLEEWVFRLPSQHRARKEYKALREIATCAVLKGASVRPLVTAPEKKTQP